MGETSVYADRIDHWQVWLAADSDASDGQRRSVERVLAAYRAAADCRSRGGCGARGGSWSPATAETASQEPELLKGTRQAVCDNCGVAFPASRSDARSCSPRCKKKLQRRAVA